MYHVTVGRFADDPSAQGVIKPADDSWQLVVDRDGYPHLYLRVNLEGGEGDPKTGMLCLDDLLPEGTTVRDLMTGAFGGQLTPEQEEAARAEYLASRARHPVPCPR